MDSIFTGKEFENLSLRECFLKKSGEEGLRLARDYEGTCLKLSRVKNHVVFALRCKKSDVVPKGLRVRSRIRTKEGRKIARNAEKAFARESLRAAEQRKRDLESRKRWLESRLKKILGCDVAERYALLIQRKAERVFLSTRDTQKSKLTALVEERKVALAEEQKRWHEKNVGKSTAISRKGWVVNLSSFELTDVECDTLRKGLNFAPTPQNVPAFDVITSVENALRQKKGVSDGVAEVARSKVAGIVSRFQREIKQGGRGPSNLSKEEKAAFEALKKDKDIVVVPADKGNATVVLDAEDYQSKALEVIGQPPFEEVLRCPRQKVEDQINEFLWSLFQQKVIKKASLQPAAMRLRVHYRDSMALLRFTRMVYRCVRLFLLLALHSMQSASTWRVCSSH